MANCDVSMTSCSNFVANKPKIWPFSVLVRLLVWLSWNLEPRSIFICWFLLLTLNSIKEHFGEKNDSFLCFWLIFVEALWKCGCYGKKRRTIFLVMVSKYRLYIFRKSQFQEKSFRLFGVSSNNLKRGKHPPPPPVLIGLSSSCTCDFLLKLATRHPPNCSVSKV